MIHLIYIYFIINAFLLGKSLNSYSRGDSLIFALFGTVLLLASLLRGLISRVAFLEKVYFYFELHVLGTYKETYYNEGHLDILSRSVSEDHLWQIEAIKNKYKTT